MGELTANGFSVPQIEQAALSSMMQWPEPSFSTVESFSLSPDHFQTPANRTIFEALREHWTSGKPVDLIAFTQELRAAGTLETIGGAPYLTETWVCCHSPRVMEYYLSIIEEAHAKRLLAKTCTQSLSEANEDASLGEPLVTGTIEALEQIPLPSRHRNRERTLVEAVTEKMNREINGESDEDIISTGIADLDHHSPLRRGDMPLIAGQRKAGKSILALNIALNISGRGIGVFYFSLEDREPKLMDRIFANVSRRSMNASGKSMDDLHAVTRAAEKIKSLPFYIRDDVFELARIAAISKELKARKNIGLIVVDYGQLVTVVEKKDVNREQKVAEVSRTLRLLAMQLDTPLILLSQLNDAGLTRESRALEQDATAMWRVDHVPAENQARGEPTAYDGRQRAVVIPWQRNGESGVGFRIVFIGEQARIENCARQDDL